MDFVANSFARKVYFSFEKGIFKSVFKLSDFAYCILRLNEHNKIVNLVHSFPFYYINALLIESVINVGVSFYTDGLMYSMIRNKHTSSYSFEKKKIFMNVTLVHISKLSKCCLVLHFAPCFVAPRSM